MWNRGIDLVCAYSQKLFAGVQEYLGPKGFWGSGENGYLGSTSNYFQGFGVQAHSFGDLGSPAKKLKNSTSLRLIFKKKFFG